MNQLDLFQSRKNRDDGMQRAVDNANDKHENWSEKAYDFLVQYCKSQGSLSTFMTEDVRSLWFEQDMPQPPSNRAWGSIARRAVKNGLIKKVGIGPVKNPKANCAYASIWVVR